MDVVLGQIILNHDGETFKIQITAIEASTKCTGKKLYIQNCFNSKKNALDNEGQFDACI